MMDIVPTNEQEDRNKCIERKSDFEKVFNFLTMDSGRQSCYLKVVSQICSNIRRNKKNHPATLSKTESIVQQNVSKSLNSPQTWCEDLDPGI